MHPTMIVSFDTEIPMRDGVVLRGDLYKPDTADRVPVLLLRTVFSKDWFGRGFGQYDPAWFVRARIRGVHPGCARSGQIGRRVRPLHRRWEGRLRYH